ncbi:MAG: hypothetical protein ACYDHH_12265 [Solirubrobacteraceae bacterium]
MRGNVAVIRLLLQNGADPNLRDTGYDATPAGWAEHHEQHEAHALLLALEQPAASDGAGAGGQVSVSAFVEHGDRVLAHVHHAADEDEDTLEDGIARGERFVVAEVKDGLIVRMCGYATELEARAALSEDPAADDRAGGER